MPYDGLYAGLMPQLNRLDRGALICCSARGGASNKIGVIKEAAILAIKGRICFLNIFGIA